jgi:rhodanese-related sulfurtransferase
MNFQDQKSAIESFAELTAEESKSFLVDVRSNGEWRTKGIASLSPFQKRVIFCEWRRYPSMEINENFFDDLVKDLDLSKIDNFYFICAAGIRSKEALMHTRVKLKGIGAVVNCINVSDGFEGNTGQIFTFGKSSGWRASGLPLGELDASNCYREVEG